MSFMTKDFSAAIMIRLIFYFLRTERRQTRSVCKTKKLLASQKIKKNSYQNLNENDIVHHKPFWKTKTITAW